MANSEAAASPMGVTIRTDISPESLRRKAQLTNSGVAIRYRALARLVEGENFRTVAVAHDVSTSTIYHWIHQFNERGLDIGGSRASRGRRCGLRIDAKLSVETVTAAATKADPRAFKRFVAIARLLEGQRPSHIARDLGVSPATIRLWVSRVNDEGLASLQREGRQKSKVAKRMRKDVTASEVQRVAVWASRQNDWRTARRLGGVADVIGGLTLEEAALRRGVSRSMVSRWCSSFNNKGIDGLLGLRCAAAIQRGQIWDVDDAPTLADISRIEPALRATDKMMKP